MTQLIMDVSSGIGYVHTDIYTLLRRDYLWQSEKALKKLLL